MSKPSVKAQAFHKSHISQIGAKNKANIVEPVKIVGAQMSALGYTPHVKLIPGRSGPY
jgi:hypothetical protein